MNITVLVEVEREEGPLVTMKKVLDLPFVPTHGMAMQVSPLGDAGTVVDLAWSCLRPDQIDVTLDSFGPAWTRERLEAEGWSIEPRLSDRGV